MQVIRKAALAPANPSATDRSVAAAASQKMNQAKQEQTQEKKEELGQGNGQQNIGKEPDGVKKITGYTKSGITISSGTETSSGLINVTA
jgi:hypothetical protein